MSGLLPRTTSTDQNGIFNNLTVQTLTVSLVGYINSLVVNTMNVANLIVSAITTSTINGNPNLTINGGIIDLVTTGAQVNGDEITTSNNIIGFTEKTIDSSTNSINITTGTLTGVNINTLINQSVQTTANPTFNGLGLTGLANDNSIVNVLGINGSNVVEYKNNISDTSTAQTFTNKSLKVPSCKLVDNSDVTKVINFTNTSALTGTNTQLAFQQTANRVVTFPDSTYNIVGDTTLQTLTNKLMQGARYWDGTGQTMQLNTSGVTGPRTWTVSDSDGTVTLNAFAATLTNKTLDSTCKLQNTPIVGSYTSNIISNQPITFDTSALTGARVITWPDTAGTVALSGNTLTMTNKTLTAPVIATIVNTGTLTLPTATDTLVARTTTDTLTNKTLDSGTSTITITNSPLSAVNVNSLINQDIRTTASPTFAAATLIGGISEFAGTVNDYQGSVTIAPPGTAVIILTLPTTSNHSYVYEMTYVGFVTASSTGNTGKGVFQKSSNASYNNAGSVSTNSAFANSFVTNGVVTGQSVSTTGTAVNMLINGTATDTIRWYWYAKVFSN